MKKAIAIALIVIIASIGLFAGQVDVTLQGTVDATAYALTLKYGTNPTADETFDDHTTDQTLAINNLVLTEDGKTKDFYLTASGNEAKAHGVTVSIEPTPFVNKSNILSDAEDAASANDHVDVAAAYVDGYDTSITVVPYGLQNNYLLRKFNMAWTGNADLTAGDYESTVKVTYSMN